MSEESQVIKNAVTANALKNSREIKIVGDAHGSVQFDGRADVVLELTVDKAKISDMTKLVTTASYAENAGSARIAVSADYAARCKGKAALADCDGEGNNIAETYVRKSEMPSFELVEGELVISHGGKKYKFAGVEVSDQ